MEDNGFTFFWKKNYWLSQWYSSRFKGSPLYGDLPEIYFDNAEQWMMCNKALLFDDHNMAEVIMTTSDPAKVKDLGRKVKKFDQEIWNQARFEIVYQGCLLKFKQDPLLKERLIATHPTTLAEASPYDKIWGIGLSEEDPRAQVPHQWRGKNLLGKALMKVRDELMIADLC